MVPTNHSSLATGIAGPVRIALYKAELVVIRRCGAARAYMHEKGLWAQPVSVRDSDNCKL